MGEESHGRFRKVWEASQVAEAYRDARFSRSRRWRFTDRRERAIVARFLAGFESDSRGLDVPCGAGRFAPVFRDAGIRHVGLDVSPAMLRLACAAGAPALLAGDALRLPFQDGGFSTLVSIRLLHRLEDREVRVRMLREMVRVSKGPILVTYYTRWNLRGIQRWLRGKRPGLGLGEIHRDVREAGLRVREAIPIRRWSDQQWFFVLERAQPERL